MTRVIGRPAVERDTTLTRYMTGLMEPTMRSWPVQQAKARFSEFLEASLQEGPQLVTRRGVEAAVLVPIAQWHRLQLSARPSLKELLLAPKPRFTGGLPVPPRGRLRRRAKPPPG
jgi:antitoxin Phd